MEERVSSSVKGQYVWSPIDRWSLLRRKRSVSGTLDETLYCLQDYLDLVAVVDGWSVVQERYGYDAFGKARIMDASFATISSSSFAWNWLFHGEFQDPETLFYNYGYRYYHTSLGKWLSSDPLFVQPFDRLSEETIESLRDLNSIPDPLNLYSFSFNNPPRLIDLQGAAALFDDVIVGGGMMFLLMGFVLVVAAVRVSELDRPDWPQSRKRWYCEATCNVQKVDPRACCPDRVSGSGSGSSQAEACREAKRDATQSAPQGCYPRHCQCKNCVKI